MHEGVRNYYCDQCDYSAATNTRVLEHIKSQHTNEKPYHCEMCDYATVRKGLLFLMKLIFDYTLKNF